MSDKLRGLLPPTDARLRPDVRHWENGSNSDSSTEKSRLETNQRQRKKALKEDPSMSDVNFSDEPSYYKPKFF